VINVSDQRSSNMTNQQDLIQRAGRVLPGGVLGSHRSGPGLEFVVKDARGAHLWDADGKRYIDYLLGSGPMLLGHAHPAGSKRCSGRSHTAPRSCC
jgi:glutamate-1-semialdehyde aminotransferase